MRRVIFFIIGVTSCISVYANAEMEAKYVSAGNDVAVINLELFKNDKFTLSINDLREANTSISKGKWKEEAENYLLKFKRKNRPDLTFLFPTEMPTVKIIDDKTIQFPQNTTELWIWNILCKKVN